MILTWETPAHTQGRANRPAASTSGLRQNQRPDFGDAAINRQMLSRLPGQAPAVANPRPGVTGAMPQVGPQRPANNQAMPQRPVNNQPTFNNGLLPNVGKPLPQTTAGTISGRPTNNMPPGAQSLGRRETVTGFLLNPRDRDNASGIMADLRGRSGLPQIPDAIWQATKDWYRNNPQPRLENFTGAPDPRFGNRRGLDIDAMRRAQDAYSRSRLENPATRWIIEQMRNKPQRLYAR